MIELLGKIQIAPFADNKGRVIKLGGCTSAVVYRRYGSGAAARRFDA